MTIRGLVVEKYASPLQSGAIAGDNTSGWLVESNEFRWNHGSALKLGDRMRVQNNYTHHNGHLGLNGSNVVDALVEGNEIAYNNVAGVDVHWSGGGTKFSRTTRLTIRGNRSHHNHGKGIWTDIDNRYTLYENNVVTDNERMGIFHEISYDAVIRNNTCERNGFQSTGNLRGGGIAVTSSPNVEIYGNTLRGNAHGIAIQQDARGSGAYGPHVVSNLYVHDNVVTMSSGLTGFMVNVADRHFIPAATTASCTTPTTSGAFPASSGGAMAHAASSNGRGTVKT